jgi:hypothetical protein
MAKHIEFVPLGMLPLVVAGQTPLWLYLACLRSGRPFQVFFYTHEGIVPKNFPSPSREN